MFRFQDPLWFGLLLVPLIRYGLARRVRRPALAIPSVGRVLPLHRGFFVRTRWLVPVLTSAAFVLMVCALARPQWGQRETLQLTRGINIVLAVDTSESMSALDFRLGGKSVNRLQAVNAVVRDFVTKRSGDRIGLVIFGSEAYTQMPLTSDYDALVSILDRVEVGAAGKSTAVGDAIGIAVKRLQEMESASNVVVLLTDGRSNTGELDPLTAAGVAKELGVRIYTIGVGTSGPVPFVVEDPLFGRRVIHRRVEIDEETLRAVAERSGGIYFHASNLEGLKKVYDTIDALEKTEIKVKTYENFDELYPRFLIPALALLLMAVVFANTRYLEIP